MAIIDSPRVTINGLTLTEQIVVPATPSSGKDVIYTSSSGLRLLTSSGSLIPMNAINSTPASASAAGVAGSIFYDATYIYICTATNTWRRINHATW